MCSHENLNSVQSFDTDVLNWNCDFQKLKLRQLNDDNESLIKGRKFIQIGATADAKLLDGGKPIQTLTTWLSIIWGRKIILALVNVFRGTL